MPGLCIISSNCIISLNFTNHESRSLKRSSYLYCGERFGRSKSKNGYGSRLDKRGIRVVTVGMEVNKWN